MKKYGLCIVILFSCHFVVSQVLSENELKAAKEYIYLDSALIRPELVLKLSLWDEGRTELPASICQLHNLQSLNVFQNELQFLPDCMSFLSVLQVLNLSHNQFEIVPEELYGLKLLKQVDLHHNKIKELNPSIAALKELQVLDLHENLIETLPKELLELKNLKKLVLKKNPLKMEEIDFFRKSMVETEIIF